MANELIREHDSSDKTDEEVTPLPHKEAYLKAGGSFCPFCKSGDAIVGDVTPIGEMREQAVAWTKLLVDNGVLVGLGTDAAYPTVWFGESVHREMEIWVNESGISPLRTSQAATYDNARILKIDDRTGSIQPGLEGD